MHKCYKFEHVKFPCAILENRAPSRRKVKIIVRLILKLCAMAHIAHARIISENHALYGNTDYVTKPPQYVDPHIVLYMYTYESRPLSRLYGIRFTGIILAHTPNVCAPFLKVVRHMDM